MTAYDRAVVTAQLAAEGVTSRDNDGWCGVPCPASDCHRGEVDGEYGPRACGRCGGTGERYESALDHREL